MLDTFASLRGNLKFDQVNTDNFMFRVHYKITFMVLMVCAVLVTSRQYFGNPINCIVDGMPSDVMDSYCWVQSTFTLPTLHSTARRVGKDVAQSGVGPYVESEQEIRHHTYYQWVCMVLFLQAVAFYVPRYAWKSMEGGRVKALLMDLGSPVLDADTARHQRSVVLRYFAERRRADCGDHNTYAFRFLACETYNFLNVFVQMWLMNVFLDRQFTEYGAEVLMHSEQPPELRTDPMSRVFPKVTKCTFHKYGPSGTMQKLDGLCVLSLNILNEKVFIFLWAYFAMLACGSLLALLYRVVTLIVPTFREMLLVSKAPHASRGHVEAIVRRLSFGDWFLLYQLGKNMYSVSFNELLTDFAKCVRENEKRDATGAEEKATAEPNPNDLAKVNIDY